MGHRQNMNERDRLKWDIMQYEAKKKAQRGQNFAYWNDDFQKKVDEGGWSFHDFKGNRSTSAMLNAKEVVAEYRRNNNWARVVCGYDSNTQKIKMFTVIYKPKPTKD